MARHIITPDIIAMLNNVITCRRGAKAVFCRATGITPYNLSRILSGKKKYIYNDDWSKLIGYIPKLEYIERGEPVPLETPEAAEITSGRIYVEEFRTALIGELISADINPVELQKVLRLVINFRKGETKG